MHVGTVCRHFWLDPNNADVVFIHLFVFFFACRSRSELFHLWWWLGWDPKQENHPGREWSGSQQAGQQLQGKSSEGKCWIPSKNGGHPINCVCLCVCQFGFRKWKSHVTERPFEDRSEVVKELYSELNLIKPHTGTDICACDERQYSFITTWCFFCRCGRCLPL